MANYRIASESEAASIGGGSSSNGKLMVTRARAISLGCTIRPSTTYTDKQLVALKDLQKIITTSCSCNAGKCSCHGYNEGCSGQCYSDSTCTCNTGVCSCHGEVTDCSDCHTHTECPCNTGKCSCYNYDPGCSGKCYSDSTCTCNSGVCTCNGYDAGCKKKCHTHKSCSCDTVCDEDCPTNYG